MSGAGTGGACAVREGEAGPWRERVGAAWLDGRVLGPGDLGRVIALHHAVLAGLPPGVLNPETDTFFADHLGEAGRILGLFDAGGALVAYGVLGLPAAGSPYNFGRDLGLAPQWLGTVAHLDGATVAEPWRGAGIHRILSQHRLALARAAKRRHVLATVAPLNVPSLRTVLAAGLRARALKPMFAGRLPRFLLCRDLKGDPELDPATGIAVPLAAADRLGHALAQGRQGYALTQGPEGPALRLAFPGGDLTP
ncbi:hypothetical protein [Pararhodospirillum oryzae]|uniref:N-acetyltransferase domain-containing protein n=1 Tax=Pararhodospirillum oryzae TaxID=478448 RepID=A0A512H782_9PROT|nr:hypothetical protein [Pararhodospirillum oryzae]GEO81288.1 hypothetical protein ROR02_14190 [Pararhodospirillum oryzae]